MISSIRNLFTLSLLTGATTTLSLALDKRANPAVVLDLDGTVIIKGGWREAVRGGERWPINTYTEYTKGQHWLIDGLGQNPPVTLQYLEWESMGSQMKSHGACIIQFEGGKDHIDGMATFKLSDHNIAYDGPLLMVDHNVVLYCALQGQGSKVYESFGMAAATFQNVYYERKVGTAKSCYICRRDTTTVLSTIKSEDFVYTCEGHLTDPGFASLIPASTPPAPSGPSAEDIKKVISDYEARQAKKTATKDKDKDKTDEKKPLTPSSSTPIPIASPPPGPPAPTHRKFALHRQIFDMRRNELRKREMGVRAKEVGKGLPAVPRGF